jgi:hypothetical protein
MKTFILSLALFLMSITLTANTGEETTKDISHKIKEMVTMPESLKQKHRSEKVTVDFTVNEGGQVIEVNAKTKDTATKRDLEKQFLQFKFEGLKPCVTNSIDINFLMY